MAKLFPCPACGGQLVYDIATGGMKCTSCGSLQDPTQYYSKDVMSQDGSLNMAVYACPNCAGEIVAGDIDSMEICPYCGSQLVAAEKFSSTGAPNYIMPFRISKQRCIEEYQKMTKGVAFVPNELKTTQGLNKFVGLYTPYWLYDYSAHTRLSVPGNKEYTRGSYDYHEKATLNFDINYDTLMIPKDASETLDDTAADKMNPFYMEDLRPFNPNYMAGFYAENSNVPGETYQASTHGDVIRELTSAVTKNRPDGFTPDVTPSAQRQLGEAAKYKSTSGAYLPLWFLTTKKNGRVAYTMVNGQTGRMVSDLPVDIGKYISASLITSIICALVFLIVVGSMQIKNTMWITLLVSIIMMIISSVQSQKVYRRENHLDDVGYQVVKNQGKANGPAKPDRTIPAPKAAIYTSGLSGLISLLVKFFSPANDFFYYGVMIITMLTLLGSVILMAKEYNRLATHPLPQFAKTGGGYDSKYQQ